MKIKYKDELSITDCKGVFLKIRYIYVCEKKPEQK